MKQQYRATLLFVSLIFPIFSCTLIAMSGEKKISKNEVPQAVLTAFEQSYPKATVKGYATETENGTTYYELESVDGKTSRDLLYTADGKVAEREESVTKKDLPDAVAKAFARESHKGHAARIEKTTKGDKVTYEFRMGKGKTELLIDRSGTVLKHSSAVKGAREKGENAESEKED